MPRREAKRRRQEALRRLLRERVVRGIHSGRLNTGDRLPTYRQVANETGVDLRWVARAYQDLEREGLVEIRGRSGVFVPTQEHLGGKVLAETARWMVDLLHGAHTREIRLPDFPEFAGRCIGTTTVRCACIESTVDVIDAICGELRRDFGFDSLPLHADRLPPLQIHDSLVEPALAELRSSDFLVTTAFHASAVRPVAHGLEKPLVIVRLNPEIVGELEERVASGELTVICVDPRYPERVRSVVGGEHGERIRGILAEDEAAIRGLDRSRPVRITRAAHERLGHLDLPLILPDTPVLSGEAVGELAELLVLFNLEAMHEKGGTQVE